MSRIMRRKPSPSMIVAGAALVVAFAGTAIAGPLATKSALSKAEKKQTRKLAGDEINKAAPGLSVANAQNAQNATNAQNAGNAGTVDGANASDLRTSSAFNEDGTDVASLAESFANVASATITTQGTGRILATGSAELFGAADSEIGRCRIVIDGVASAEYQTEPDDLGNANQDVIAVNFAVTRPAGTYTASLQCSAVSGVVGKDVAAINVYGLGA